MDLLRETLVDLMSHPPYRFLELFPDMALDDGEIEFRHPDGSVYRLKITPGSQPDSGDSEDEHEARVSGT